MVVEAVATEGVVKIVVGIARVVVGIIHIGHARCFLTFDAHVRVGGAVISLVIVGVDHVVVVTDHAPADLSDLVERQRDPARLGIHQHKFADWYG